MHKQVLCRNAKTDEINGSDNKRAFRLGARGVQRHTRTSPGDAKCVTEILGYKNEEVGWGQV